jgi:hypothetical protein
MKKNVIIKTDWKFYAIIFLIVFISGLSLTYAYGGTSPAVMGHNLAEIGIPTCSNGQILSYSSGNLICANLPTQSPSGSCSFCKTCGGQFPLTKGAFVNAFTENTIYGFGTACAQPYAKQMNHGTIYLCCNN